MATEVRLAPRSGRVGLSWCAGPSLRRRVIADSDLRSEADLGELRGYAIVFNQASMDLGGFREVVLPKAVEFDEDVLALVSHDAGRVLGRVRSGTLSLTIDEVGVAFRVALPATQNGQEVAELVQRGDIDGMSFGFTTLEDRWAFNAEPALRKLVRIRVHEISPVAWPAYPDTSVAKRSLAAARAGNPRGSTSPGPGGGSPSADKTRRLRLACRRSF